MTATRPEHGPPHLDQELAERQLQLIRSTYRLIGERGAHRTSLREIAQGAGLSKGLIPYYFATKENLILATMRWALSETANRIRRAMAAAATPEDKVVAMVDAIFVEPEANRRFHVAYLDLVESAARERRYMELSETFDGIVNSLHADVIRSGVAAGAFAVEDVDEAAMALRALVDGLFVQWLQEADWRGEHARYRDVCKRAALRLLGAQRPSGRRLELERADAVRAALAAVEDPELGLDIVSLGLVYEVDVVGTRARVTYTLTTMGCPAAALIEQRIVAAALGVDGVERVDPELVFSPAWSPDRMSDDARVVLGFGV